MDSRPTATLQAGRGLVDNVHQGGRRQVTLLDAGRWREATGKLGTEVDPVARRANLLVEGLELKETGGRILRVGSCRLHVRGETRPCERMDEACPGLRRALEVDWAGGVYAEVLDDGEIAVGDAVSWET